MIDASDAPAFKRANITFKQINDVITEPIINFRVSAHCEPNINRDYALLLDPAPLASAESKFSDIADQEKIPVKKQDKRVTNLTMILRTSIAFIMPTWLIQCGEKSP